MPLKQMLHLFENHHLRLFTVCVPARAEQAVPGSIRAPSCPRPVRSRPVRRNEEAHLSACLCRAPRRLARNDRADKTNDRPAGRACCVPSCKNVISVRASCTSRRACLQRRICAFVHHQRHLCLVLNCSRDTMDQLIVPQVLEVEFGPC